MCFSISFNIHPKAYVERYKSIIQNINTINNINNINFQPAYFISAFDFPELPLITKENIILAKWGLVPHWFKENNINDIRVKTLNAKVETLHEKVSFKNLLNKNRCLLGVTGFFEWRYYNNEKFPYFIKLKNTEIFSLACLYDVCNYNNQQLITFSVITTTANKIMENIHNIKKRMPLIIEKEFEDIWVKENINNNIIKEISLRAQELCFEYYTVSKIVNYSDKNRNIPAAIEPFKYEDLPEFL